MTNQMKRARFGALIILILIFIGFTFDDPRYPVQTMQKPHSEVLKSSTPVYNFPAYRTVTPKPEPKKVIKKKAVIKKKTVVKNSFTTQITGYCSCDICTGKWDKKMKVGEVAASRSFPFGTRLRIGNKTYTVKDRLSPKYDHRVDIYCKTHEQAQAIGNEFREVEVVK